MRLLTGTSGFSYKAWKGSFYPRDLPAAHMLRFYASRLRTVEINSTFRRLPNPGVISRWAENVPEAFVFVIKAPQRITHRSRLVDTREPVASLWNELAQLGGRLGPVLFQLPPNFKKDLPRLSDFLAQLPRGCRAAFEFRHASWSDGEVHEVLRRARAALCMADTDDLPEPELVATADWGYLRLRRARYPRKKLAAWAERIARTGWKEAFVFFKHEDEGVGPKLAVRFARLFPDSGAATSPRHRVQQADHAKRGTLSRRGSSRPAGRARPRGPHAR